MSPLRLCRPGIKATEALEPRISQKVQGIPVEVSGMPAKVLGLIPSAEVLEPRICQKVQGIHQFQT